MAFNDARFNQDGTCICVANDRGFKILNSNPMVLTCDRDLRYKNVGAVGTAEMLYRSNLLALVGNSEYYDIRKINSSSLKSKFIKPWKQNILTIWDDKKFVEVAQLVFTDSIINVKFLYDLIAVSLNYKVYVYQMSDVSLLHCSNTINNPYGVISVSTYRGLNFIAYPGKLKGSIMIQIYTKNRISNSSETSFYSEDYKDSDAPDDVFEFDEMIDAGEKIGKYTKLSMKLQVHVSEVTSIDFSPNGLLVVTSSIQGRYIKMFDTLSGELIQVFRKTNNFGRVTKCIIDKEMKWLCVISEKPKMYMYQIDQAAIKDCDFDNENRKVNFKNSCIFDINNEDKDIGKYFKHYRSAIAYPSTRCGDYNIFKTLVNKTKLYIHSTGVFAHFKPRNKDRIIDCALMLDKETIVIILQTGRAMKLFFNPAKYAGIKLVYYHHL
ncbi:uncharacterized protein TOT_010000573 [Theileria orientalis strain Shintoku]|uniref:Uncharacterized protein n=1 Tax=Theileria orientalis strain Shintoku TaxID=869250 RepID=J4C2Q7_THEOR|nr:uncharacterized protein TOT_010000573 [Theileria orientalis strain Shintoku]BAM39111.1 uncharacterized protein TOT_010000573 [Theileria orientalis strain Shintoku]|eukprot:XP_009689412.1 uncharacterized protein TOT_010000573 [Theileria orientalis strain Shintoku]